MVNFTLCADFKFDTDGNDKADRWLKVDIFKKWEALDLNKNGKPDETYLYISDKNIVYFINEESYDYSGNGKADIWINNKREGKKVHSVVKADTDNNNKIDPRHKP